MMKKRKLDTSKSKQEDAHSSETASAVTDFVFKRLCKADESLRKPEGLLLLATASGYQSVLISAGYEERLEPFLGWIRKIVAGQGCHLQSVEDGLDDPRAKDYVKKEAGILIRMCDEYEHPTASPAVAIIRICSAIMMLDHCACFDWRTLISVSLDKDTSTLKLRFDTESG